MEMDSVIRQLYAQWRIAKDKARQECESRSLPNVAEKYRKCTMFKGTEDVQGVLRLFSTTQGIEFCMGYHFPNLATMRLFKPYIVPERHGIYLDAGAVTINDPSRVILIGRTTATVNCSKLDRHEVILMHGAKAVINASEWAVVFVKAEQGCTVIRSTTDNAMIL